MEACHGTGRRVDEVKSSSCPKRWVWGWLILDGRQLRSRGRERATPTLGTQASDMHIVGESRQSTTIDDVQKEAVLRSYNNFFLPKA